MEFFDTVLLGSGYSSCGYAASGADCLIVEEQEIADTHFYLPLRSYRHTPYTPVTDEGRALSEIFNSLGLIRDGKQNANGFEVALCRYLEERELPILLKARAVGEREEDGRTVLTLSTNEGLLKVACRRVIDTRSGKKNERMTVLIAAREEAAAIAASLLTGYEMTEAFYPGQYALFAPLSGDINVALCKIADALDGAEGVRILAVAPAFAADGEGRPLSDDDYENPIAAFEAGYRLGKEAVQ